MKRVRTNAFEIDSVAEDESSGLMFFWVKLVGKCTPPLRKDPLELLKEITFKNSFSNEDYNWIVDALLENQKRLIEIKYKKKYSLIKHQFSEQLEEPLVIYTDLDKKIYIKPAKEIYSNRESINKFSSNDSACIGNIVGGYQIEKEYKLRTENKINNVIKFDTSQLSG